MITSGSAITDFSQDELGRSRLAERLATAIADYEFENSLVVALYGKWGTGKTSLLNLTEKAFKKGAEDGRPIVVRFNPWNYVNQSELVSQYFDELSLALKRPDIASQYDRASALLDVLSKRSSILESIPAVGRAAKGAGWFMKTFAKGLREDATDLRDLVKIKTEISKVLSENKRRIVVIIDDIDRLSSTEIRQIFQLVKTLADFSNLVYVLAFDRTVVVPALEKVQEGSGEAYLEKIVNVPIELPVITAAQIQRLLIERVNLFASRHAEYDWTERNQHLARLLAYARPLFTTIRALDRLVNVLLFSDSLVSGEIEYADFVAISVLQAVNLNVYQFVRDNSTLFIDTPLSKLMAPKDGDVRDRDAILASINRACAHGGAEDTIELLKELFPRLQRLFDSKAYGDAEQRQWDRERRICASLESFETYFQLQVPATSLTLARINQVLDDLSEAAFNEAFQALIEEGTALGFLAELENYYDDPRVRSHAPDIVKVLFNLGDAFPDDFRQFPIKLDGPTMIMRIVYRLTRELQTEEARFAVLKDALESISKSLFTAVQSISVEDQTAGRYDLGGTADPTARLVTDGHLDSLEVLAREKIEEWARDGRLSRSDHLAYILYRWSNWGGGDNLRRFVIERLTDEEFVDLFGTIGFGTGYSQIAKKPMLFGPEVELLAPVQEVFVRLQKIKESASFAALSEDARRNLTALLDGQEKSDRLDRSDGLNSE